MQSTHHARPATKNTRTTYNPALIFDRSRKTRPLVVLSNVVRSIDSLACDAAFGMLAACHGLLLHEIMLQAM
jgi:hypothetical protein